MSVVAASIYWVVIALWLVVLATICTFYIRNPLTFGTTRLLLAVLAIDTLRNIIENLYFGFYFGAQYGFFPAALIGVMGRPEFLIIPKLINVVAACAVLSLLLLRWLPAAHRERQAAERNVSQSSKALAQETEENRRLFQTSADVILVADRDRTIRRVSQSCLSILGYTPEDMVGRQAEHFVAPGDMEKLRRHIRQKSARGEVIRNIHTDFVHKDGRCVTLALTGVWSEPVKRFFFIGRDTTERRAVERELTRLAHFDQLTGLLNRTSLLRDLETISRSKGKGFPGYAIATLDLDGFKAINDKLGHLAGDRLLQQAAERLQAAAAGIARAYRIGGDEFVMIFPGNCDPLEIGRVVGTALKHIEAGFDLGNHGAHLGASAGIAIASDERGAPSDLLADADLALYEAKAIGGGNYRLFIPPMRAKAAAREQLDIELRRACVNREFVLYYQPQIRLSDGAVVGAEALLRWRHPERGLLAPAAFIDALATNSAALEVGNWILRTACETAASWPAKGLPAIRIGVNLFPAQFHDDTLFLDVESALQTSGLPARNLELEITENIALTDDDAMLASLRALRGIGVGLAFDDFGTGYASLSFLTRYPLTRLKIDKTFVHRIAGTSTTDSGIVRSIILMAHNLGLEVTAEGVETATQASLLKNKRCDEAQGYHYARPLPADEFEAYLRGQNQPAISQETGKVA